MTRIGLSLIRAPTSRVPGVKDLRPQPSALRSGIDERRLRTRESLLAGLSSRSSGRPARNAIRHCAEVRVVGTEIPLAEFRCAGSRSSPNCIRDQLERVVAILT